LKSMLSLTGVECVLAPPKVDRAHKVDAEMLSDLNWFGKALGRAVGRMHALMVRLEHRGHLLMD
jgi:hypothetical protein